MGKATYQLNKPFPFMKKGYSDSLSLVLAFLEHWDVAISVFRRGDMQSFWTEYVSNGEKEAADFFASAYNAMWKDAEKEDVLFQKVIHYIEPNLEGMPLIPAGEKTARLYNFKEVADWLEESFESKDTLIIPQKEPDIFNAESYNLLWLDAAMKEGVFSAYMPALKEIESSFIQKDDKAKVFLGRKLVAELIGIPYFTYEGHIYTSPTELIKKNTDDKDTARLFRFLGDVFSSKSCVAELEKWSKATLKKENQTDKRLVEFWGPLDKEMKSAKGAKWYESYRFPKKESVIFSTSLHLSEYECNQEKKEACVREQIKYLQRQIESAKKEKALIDTQRGFLALLASDHLYDEEQWKELEQIIASYDKRVKEGEKYLKAAESILPVVVNQEYVEHIEQVEEGTARRYLSKLAIWPTETMSEDYRDEFFAKFEKMLLEQAQKEVADKELFADADSVRLALCHLVGGLEKNADTDTRRVQGVPILDYYTRKLDTFAGVCEKAGVGKPWYSLYKPVDLCNRYGKRLADKVSGERHELQKKAESLDAAHSVKNSVLEFGGSTPGKGDHHYGAYNKWKTLRDTYKDAIKMYQESDSKLAADIKHELEHVLPEGEAPLGEIVKSKDEAYERVKKLLSERKQNYEKYTEKLTDYKKRSTELKAELNNAWTKEQEKRKKEKEAEQRKNARKQKRKKFFETLWSIITFPFKVILVVLFFPFVLWKKSAFLGIVATMGYVALISFFFRYASPTYYGTEFYLGNKLGYRHYKVADGVTVIEPSTFRGAMRMKSVELPDSLTRIESEAFEACGSITELDIPSSVTYFGDYAFSYCKSLEKVKINAYEYELDGHVFDYCVSLTDIETVNEMPEGMLSANTNGCRNLEREEMLALGSGYGAIPKDFPLLENEVQLKNAMDTGYSNEYGYIVNVFYNPKTDKLANIQIGEEQKTEDGRSVSVTFTLQKDFIEQDFVGTITSYSSGNGWESVDKSFEQRGQRFCMDKLETMQQQFAEGNFSELETMLAQYSFTVGEENVSFGEDQVTVEQAQVVPLFTTEVNEAGETVLPENPAYRIAIKATVDKALNDYTFMGNMLISEKYNYTPQIITNMSEWNGLNLLGSYSYNDSNGSYEMSIDSQYDNVYTVMDNGQKKLLVWNEDGKSGRLVSADDSNNYSVYTMSIDTYEDALVCNDNGISYRKVSDETTAPDEEFRNPLVGVWEGTYDTSRSHVASRRYIFPAGGDYLTVISTFGPTSQTPDFKYGGTVDVLLWNEEYNSGIIESRAWLQQPEGYSFVIFEGNLDESGTVMSGGGEYPFYMTKTEANNDNCSYGTNNGAGWSIYDGNGNPWPGLFAVSDDIPTDALQFEGNYYKFYSDASTWEEAQTKCVERGGHLAIIDSGEENAFLHSYFVKYGYERCNFGLSDVAEEGNWTWIDGTSAGNRYSNFNSAQPDADTVYEDYAEFWNNYPDGTWNDCYYVEGSGYICEWD